LTTKNIQEYQSDPAEYAANEENEYNTMRAAAADLLTKLLEVIIVR